MDEKYKILIGGEWVDSKEKKTFDTYSPINGEFLSTCVDADKESVDLAVKAAWKAFKEWKDISCDERADMLEKLGEKLEENAEKLALVETMDTGKAIRESSLADIPGGTNQYKYYAGAVKTIKDEMKVVDKNTINLIFREPYGVVGQITPWNFPYLLAMKKVAPAIAAGNTIVIKPSSEAPLSLLEFAKIASEILPPGVINVITGKGSTTGKYMLEHEGFRKLDFTGSTEVGYAISKAAAEKLIPATLELGGKSANIVFPDCNWEKTLEGIKMGILFCQGQVCLAGSRIFVHEDIYDKFLKDCIEEFDKVRVGDPFVMETQVGTLTSESQLKKVLNYIEIGKKEGAKVACGGYQLTDKGMDKGYFMKPTILTDVDNKMRVAQEEIFGPVACFIKFKNEEDVIEMTNDNDYGLSGGIWTQDINRAIKVSKAIDTGLMFVNCYSEISLGTPFGGYKKSGYGRLNDLIALDNYSQVKTIHISMKEEKDGWYDF